MSPKDTFRKIFVDFFISFLLHIEVNKEIDTKKKQIMTPLLCLQY